MDTLAIKYDEIPNMQSAIDNYMTEVDNCLNKIKAYEIGGNAGVYGTQTAVINSYIERTCEQIHSIVLHFGAFKTALDKVKSNYEQMGSSYKTGDVAPHKIVQADDIINVKPFSN